MFIGHFGVGFGVKSATSRVSLGTLFLAVQLADLLWPTLLLLGVERVRIVPGITILSPLDFEHYPISHSLLMGLVWGAVLGVGYWLRRRNLRDAVLVALCVPSHWLLDLLMHRPDLPFYPGASPLVGFGLWNHPVAGQLLEGALSLLGLILYLRHTAAKNKAGQYGLWALVVFLVLVHVSSFLSPLPTSTDAIGWGAQSMWLVILWAYWVDRNRVARVAPSPADGYDVQAQA